MNEIERTEVSQKLITILQSTPKVEDSWVELATLGSAIRISGINIQALGFEKLKALLLAFPELLEIKEEGPEGKPQVVYARLKAPYDIPTESTPSYQSDNDEQPARYASNLAPDNIERFPSRDSWLYKWAVVPYFKLGLLAELALPEKWYYGDVEPEDENKFPILKNYLAYTFKRLVYEKKIEIKFNTEENTEYAAFNTGLVDRKYETIYALFKQNTKYTDVYWYLAEFVVPGEAGGKTLIKLFNPLPQKADYFHKNIKNIYYDTSSGQLSCDYGHILVERCYRLPLEFLLDNCPVDFLSIDGVDINQVYGRKENDEERRNFFRNLGEKIKNDSRILNRLKNRMQDAVDLALKRVEWNYKTAIPVYNPSRNRMSFLLPLALVDEEKIDLTLMVERQASGAYQGETILPLDSAYRLSRLITYQESDWLKTDKIANAESADSAD